MIVGIRVYNKGPDHIQKLDQNKSSNRELRSFLLQREYYSVDEHMSYFLHLDCINM